RPGDQLFLEPGARVRFEPGKRVPGAPASGAAWADPPDRRSPQTAARTLGTALTLTGGALVLMRASVPRAQGGAWTARALLFVVVLAAVAWGVYAARAAPDLALGAPGSAGPPGSPARSSAPRRSCSSGRAPRGSRTGRPPRGPIRRSSPRRSPSPRAAPGGLPGPRGADTIDARHGERQDRRQGRPRAQSQEHRPRDPPRPARRDHRALRLRQVIAGVRHDLRRGPAPLRRVALGLRARVPGADGEALGGLVRGGVPSDLDRAEDDVQEPAPDRRHRHRDLRLLPRALRPGRGAALPVLRPGDLGADGAADGGPRARPGAGDAAPPAGARRARAQGRVQEALLRPPAPGVYARPRQRRGPRARR